MPRIPPSLLALVLGATTALGLASCGEEDAQLLPGETAREITANLDAVNQLADEGDCVGAESAALQVSEQIEAVSGVDRELKRALEEGATRLNEVISGCEESTTEAIAPATVPEETEVPPEEDEKEDKEQEKQEEAEEKEQEEDAAEAEGNPALPPQAQGEGKGLDDGDGNGSAPEGESDDADEEGASGGVSPGAPAGEGE